MIFLILSQYWGKMFLKDGGCKILWHSQMDKDITDLLSQHLLTSDFLLLIMCVILQRLAQFNNTGLSLLLLFCLAAPHLHAQLVTLCFCFPIQRGEASWGNTTVSWPPRSWTTWPRAQSSTRQSSSSGTKVSSKTVPLAFSTWRSFSSSTLRWDIGENTSRRRKEVLIDSPLTGKV